MGVALTLFAFLLIDWSVMLGHPRMVQQSLGHGSDYCNDYTVSKHWSASQLCSWLGHYDVGNREKHLVFIDAKNSHMIHKVNFGQNG